MPTIAQLPPAAAVTAADIIPISQAGALIRLASARCLPACSQLSSVTQGHYLDVIVTGPGGPEPVTVGTGLVMGSGLLSATGRDHSLFPQQSTLLSSDQVVTEQFR